MVRERPTRGTLRPDVRRSCLASSGTRASACVQPGAAAVRCGRCWTRPAERAGPGSSCCAPRSRISRCRSSSSTGRGGCARPTRRRGRSPTATSRPWPPAITRRLAVMQVSSAAEWMHRPEEHAESRRQLNEAQAVAQVGSWSADPATGRVTFSDEEYRLYGLDPALRGPRRPAPVPLADPPRRPAGDPRGGGALLRHRRALQRHAPAHHRGRRDALARGSRAGLPRRRPDGQDGRHVARRDRARGLRGVAARRSPRCRRRGPASSRPQTPSAAVSSAICTTNIESRNRIVVVHFFQQRLRF